MEFKWLVYQYFLVLIAGSLIPLPGPSRRNDSFLSNGSGHDGEKILQRSKRQARDPGELLKTILFIFQLLTLMDNPSAFPSPTLPIPSVPEEPPAKQDGGEPAAPPPPPPADGGGIDPATLLQLLTMLSAAQSQAKPAVVPAAPLSGMGGALRPVGYGYGYESDDDDGNVLAVGYGL